MALSWASSASAHNSLSSSEPSDGAVLDTAPTTWTLNFTGDVPLESASGEIVLSDGSRVELAPAVHGASPAVIVFTLPDNVTGEVTARWRLVGTDGHTITGRVQFTVNLEPATTTSPPVEESVQSSTTVVVVEEEQIPESTTIVPDTPSDFIEPTSEVVHWVLQLVSYLGLVAIGGLVFADIALARGILRRPRVTLALQGGSLALFVTSAMKGLIYIADLEGVSLTSSFRHLGSIFDTTAGSMLAVRTLIGFILLLVTLPLDRRPLEFKFVRTLAALVILHIVTLPFTGHSRSMRWPALGVPADIVHLLGMTIWAGGLVAVVAFIMPAAQSSNAVTAYVRFSSYASKSVIAIVVTGLIQAIRLHEDPSTVFDSFHGVILAIKIALVAVMLGVGWRNRQLLTDRSIRAENDLRSRLIRASAVEAGLGVVVIGISAVLVRATFT